MSVCPKRDLKGASETKVGDLEVVLRVDEHIVGLEVAMEDARSMEEGETEDELSCEILCFASATIAIEREESGPP